jgi:hypothetical protein
VQDSGLSTDWAGEVEGAAFLRLGRGVVSC